MQTNNNTKLFTLKSFKLLIFVMIYLSGHNLLLSKLNKFEQMRTEVNKVLEAARVGKLIGPSLEAKVCLHTPDASLASRLHEMCAASNEADALHRIFITSQVYMVIVLIYPDSCTSDLISCANLRWYIHKLLILLLLLGEDAQLDIVTVFHPLFIYPCLFSFWAWVLFYELIELFRFQMAIFRQKFLHVWITNLLKLYHTLESFWFKEATEFGLVCHVQRAWNVRDAGITRLKLVLLPNTQLSAAGVIKWLLFNLNPQLQQLVEGYYPFINYDHCNIFTWFNWVICLLSNVIYHIWSHNFGCQSWEFDIVDFILGKEQIQHQERTV